MRPRPPASQGLRAANHARDKDVEQVRRLLSTSKPAPKAAPAGGGVVGMAQVVASNGSVTWAAGQIEMNYAGVTYNSPTDPNAGSGGGESSVPVSSWLTTSYHQIMVTPGWYVPVLYMRITWVNGAQSPAVFGGPYTNGGWDSVHNDYGIHPKVGFSSGAAGFVQIANYGPTYMGAGTDLHAELKSIGGPPTGACSPASSAIVWNITKLT